MVIKTRNAPTNAENLKYKHTLTSPINNYIHQNLPNFSCYFIVTKMLVTHSRINNLSLGLKYKIFDRGGGVKI